MIKPPARTTAGRASATNRLLAGLPEHDRHRLLAQASRVELAANEILYEPGAPIRAVYFPTGGSVSQIATVRDHDQLQVGLVGDEGMLGTSLVLGVAIAPSLTRVQHAGAAWRIDAGSFCAELRRRAALHEQLRRYVHVVMCELAQAIACTRFHFVEARLAHWLLTARDRAHDNHFHATHESLAAILGVRRAGISHAAGALQQQRFIHYCRGEITVLDPRGLQASACACYLTNRATYSRAMDRKRKRSPTVPRAEHSLRALAYE